MNRRSQRALGTASLSAIALSLALGSSVGWASLANCVEPTDSNTVAESTNPGLTDPSATPAAETAQDDAQPATAGTTGKGFNWKKLLPGSPW